MINFWNCVSLFYLQIVVISCVMWPGRSMKRYFIWLWHANNSLENSTLVHCLSCWFILHGSDCIVMEMLSTCLALDDSPDACFVKQDTLNDCIRLSSSGWDAINLRDVIIYIYIYIYIVWIREIGDQVVRRLMCIDEGQHSCMIVSVIPAEPIISFKQWIIHILTAECTRRSVKDAWNWLQCSPLLWWNILLCDKTYMFIQVWGYYHCRKWSVIQGTDGHQNECSIWSPSPNDKDDRMRSIWYCT